MPKETNAIIEHNFYAIQTEENKEFYVKNSIKKAFKNFDVFIPIDRSRTTIKGVSFNCYNRSMPEYVIVACEDINKDQANVINSLPGVISILCESTSSGVLPSAFKVDEIKKISNSLKRQEEIYNLVNCNIIIMNGHYAGSSAIVKKVTEDNLSVIVNTKNKPKIKIAIWDIGKEV